MTDRPQVLQICHDYRGPFATVARHWAGCFPDCEVTTIFLRGFPRPDLVDAIPGEVKFLSLDKGSLRGLKFGPARQLEEAVGDQKPRLIIAHRYKPLYLAWLSSRRIQPPVILGVAHEYGFLGRPHRRFLSRFWKPGVCLVGVSRPVTAEILASNSHLEGRVFTVPLAIEAPVLHDAVTARHELGIPLGNYCYGFIGRFVAKKNLPLLVSAFARLSSDAVLALIGDGEEFPHVQALAKQLDIADRVIFCGHKEDARRYMKAFDAFVMPSTVQEAFGVVLLEAMAAAVPIVCCDAPGPLSVVGDTALVFRSDDVDGLAERLAEVRQLPRTRLEDLSRAGLARLGEEFAFPVMMRRVRDLPPLREHLPLAP